MVSMAGIECSPHKQEEDVKQSSFVLAAYGGKLGAKRAKVEL